MPDQIELQNTILSADYKMATLINADLLLMQKGGVPKDKAKIRQFKRNINALSYQVYGRVDYTSSTTLTLYDCLKQLIGIDTSTVTIDPNYQAPNTTIVIEGGGSSAITYTYTEADLLDAGGGNYYLPYTLDAKFVPILLTINGVSTVFTFDETFSPARIFGFANNDTQTILLTVISTTT